MQTKTMAAEDDLKKLLADGPISSEQVMVRAAELGISERTVKIAKQNLGVKSFRQGDTWYCTLPDVPRG